MKIKNYFFILTAVLVSLISNTIKAQEAEPTELPTTIKELRVHFPAVLSFGVYKPLNEKDLVGLKAAGGVIFPAVFSGVYAEYRHYFKPMNNAQGVSRGSFFYAVKPYYDYFVTFTPGASASNSLGISGAFGYEWKGKSGFFIRPAIEPNYPIINKSDAWEDAAGATLAQSLVSSVAIGFKW